MPFDYRTPTTTAELQQLGLILSQCFNSPPSQEPTYLNRIGRENVRVLYDRAQIVGGLGILQLGQWYHSARVPMAGIAAVGIAPEYRGQGTAIALLQSVLQELHTQKTPISVLFSAAQPLYRKLGYEQAGTLCLWEVPTDQIQIRDYSLPMQAVPNDSLQTEFATLYQQQASSINGNLDRNDVIWQTLREAQNGMPAHLYRIGSVEHPEGYLLFRHQPEGKSYQIIVRDWVLLTPAAVKRFWTFLGDHRSQIDTVQWRSAPVDSLSLFLPDQTAKIRSIDRWMMRIVHVQHALEQRKYPQDIEAELHFEIQDSLLPDNTGKFVLAIANGTAQVTRGGRGDLQLDINALAALYTGLFSPEQLQLWGKVTGSEGALKTAKQVFSGALPWMPDFF